MGKENRETTIDILLTACLVADVAAIIISIIKH